MKMRKTLITALVLGACVGTQAFAATAVFQTKEGVMNFALTRQYQYQPNTTVFMNPAPLVYSTKTAKITTTSVIQAISQALYGTPNHFTSKAVLILGKGGEIHGQGYVYNLDHNPELSGFFGTFSPENWKFDSDLNGNVTLDNGRNHHLNYFGTDPSTNFVAAPTGLSEPWGQVWLKDTGQTDPYTDSTLCLNVTYFFTFKVQECYDCLYMNSFVSDSKFKAGVVSGPPCCSPTRTQSGTGTDKYYLTLTFDNTVNNPNLNWYTENNRSNSWENDWYIDLNGEEFPNFGGLFETDDGVTPDALAPGGHDYHPYDTYTLRFTLNGILTYKWTLKNLNSGDAWPDFIGSASYPCDGYGYVAKTCSLIDGSVTITERLVPICDCCSVNGGSDFDEDGVWFEHSRGLYGRVDGFYTDYFGHYHPFNDWIFYHPGFNNNYQDYKEWFEDDITNWDPGVIEEERFFDGKYFAFDLAPLLP